MASSSLVSDLQKQINRLHEELLNKTKPIKNLKYVGINMKPCEYCKNNIGYHYHDLDKKIAWPNWDNNKHMCEYCKKCPGGMHWHIFE